MFIKVAENLRKLGYQVTLFDTKEQAADYLCGAIKDTTVAFGGSSTLEEPPKATVVSLIAPHR